MTTGDARRIATRSNLEERVRPSAKRNDYYKAHAKDVRRLVLPHRRAFKAVRCPACDLDNRDVHFVKKGFTFRKCSSCQTVYISPRPPRKILDTFYQNAECIRMFSALMKDVEKERTRLFFKPRVKRVLTELRKHHSLTGKLLEIGCGIGTFLEIIRDATCYECYGLDPDAYALAVASGKGLTTFCSTVEDFDPRGHQFDVVLNFETIEHVFSPLAFLEKINVMLPPGGLLVFTTPNYQGFDVLMLGRHYKNVYGPNHLNYFNAGTIGRLLERAGFETVSVQTPGILDVSIARNQLTEVPRFNNNGFINHLLFEAPDEVRDAFQKFLQENRLSSNMFVIARKV